MKKIIFTFLTVMLLGIMFTGCKYTPKEQLTETFKFRRKAVLSQTGNLVDDVAMTYTDKDAVMKDLDTFIRKDTRVDKVTLASVPMSIHPFSISMTEVERAAPKPIGKYISRKRFNRSEDMVWYRELLRQRVPYWYQSKQNTQMISYIFPVLKELNPAVILYVLKLDYDKQDNPILFWNVPKKHYAQELLKREKEFLKKYFILKKEAEEKLLTAEQERRFKEAKVYYDIRFKEVEKTSIQREEEFRRLQKKESDLQKEDNNLRKE